MLSIAVAVILNGVVGSTAHAANDVTVAAQKHRGIILICVHAEEVGEVNVTEAVLATGARDQQAGGGIKYHEQVRMGDGVRIRRADQQLGTAQLVGHRAEDLVSVSRIPGHAIDLRLIGRAAPGGGNHHWIRIIVVHSPGREGDAQLLEVVGAKGTLGAGFWTGERWEAHLRQDGDDGYDD